MIKIDNNYKKAFVEVEAVLNCLNSEEYCKIPENLINAISENKDENYIFEYDETLDYEEWNLTIEAKAVLYNILKKYLATEEQKEYFKEKEKYEYEKIEKEKAKKYIVDDIFSKDKIEFEDKTEENNKMIEYKESIIKKFFSKLKEIFRKDKNI